MPKPDRDNIAIDRSRAMLAEFAAAMAQARRRALRDEFAAVTVQAERTRELLKQLQDDDDAPPILCLQDALLDLIVQSDFDDDPPVWHVPAHLLSDVCWAAGWPDGVQAAMDARRKDIASVLRQGADYKPEHERESHSDGSK